MREETKAALWAALFAVGAEGANSDTKHPQRKLWEALRKECGKDLAATLTEASNA